MNIPIPKGIKSPTVIIVGGKEPDDKRNNLALSRMDNLERKLDAQYKSFIDKTDYIKVIESMQKSFMSNFNKMMAMNKSMMSKAYQEKFSSLRDEFQRTIKLVKDDKNDEKTLRVLSSKLGSLETAIKDISLKPQVVRVNTGNNKQLLASFDSVMKRMEDAIRRSGPRLIPSPS